MPHPHVLQVIVGASMPSSDNCLYRFTTRVVAVESQPCSWLAESLCGVHMLQPRHASAVRGGAAILTMEGDGRGAQLLPQHHRILPAHAPQQGARLPGHPLLRRNAVAAARRGLRPLLQHLWREAEVGDGSGTGWLVDVRSTSSEAAAERPPQQCRDPAVLLRLRLQMLAVALFAAVVADGSEGRRRGQGVLCLESVLPQVSDVGARGTAVGGTQVPVPSTGVDVVVVGGGAAAAALGLGRALVTQGSNPARGGGERVVGRRCVCSFGLQGTRPRVSIDCVDSTH